MAEFDVRSFALAKHNGTIIVDWARTGKWQTFQVSTILGGAMMGERAVRVLFGPDPAAFQRWATFNLFKDGQVQVLCRRCNGSLTDAKSMARGPGDICQA
jgi:hypothetical protein